jgi:hypothetical protein
MTPLKIFLLALALVAVAEFLIGNAPPTTPTTERPVAQTHVMTEHEQCIDFIRQYFDADVARKSGTAQDYKRKAADTGFSWPVYRGMMISIVSSEQCK